MSIPVRQSTAFECAIGPILDADGVAVTDSVVGDFKIKKTTGNFAALNASATLTHVSAGVYDLVLTTSDLDTVGLATVAIDDTVNACASLHLQVIEEAVYDNLYAASAVGPLAANSDGSGLTEAGGTGDQLTALATQASVDAIDDFLDTEIAAILAAVDTEIAAIITTLGTPAGASISADILTIDNFVDGLESTIGAAGAGLTAIPWNANWDAEVQSEVTDSLVAHNLDHLCLTATAAADMTAEVADNTILSRILSNGDTSVFDPSTDGLQPIRDRGDAAWTTATGFSTHSAADVWAAATRTLTALDEDSTTIDLDAAIRAAVGLASANLDTQLTAIDDAVDTEVAAILAAVDTEVGAIQTTLAALFTTALTESYRADGATGSVAQLLYEINQTLGERSISGATVTVKKVDGSTTAFTQTLDDDTTPTSITHAA